MTSSVNPACFGGKVADNMSLFDKILWSAALLDVVMGWPFVLSSTVEPFKVVNPFCFLLAMTADGKVDRHKYFRQFYEKVYIDSRRLYHGKFNRIPAFALLLRRESWLGTIIFMTMWHLGKGVCTSSALRVQGTELKTMSTVAGIFREKEVVLVIYEGCVECIKTLSSDQLAWRV